MPSQELPGLSLRSSMDLNLSTPRGTSAFIKVDTHVSHQLYSKVGKRVPLWLLEGLEMSGHGVLWFSMVLVVALWPSVPWNIRICAINLLFAMVLDIIAVGGCKPQVVADQYSFPSGHASRSILVAGMFLVCKDFLPLFIVVLMVLWGVATSTSRVLLGRHYLSDVLVGALLGIAVTTIMTVVRSSCSHRDSCCEGFVVHRKRLL
jgi:presqualene diphosphate phosphatase